MAVAVGHKSSDANAVHTNVGSLTLAHDCTGDTELLVCACFANVQPSAVTMTYAGVSMTLVATVTDSTNAAMWVFSLASPTTGSNNIIGTFTGATNGSTLNGISFTGSNGIGTFGSFHSSAATSATASVTLASGGMAMGFCMNRSGSGTALSTSNTPQFSFGDTNWMDTIGASNTGVGSVSVAFSSSAAAGTLIEVVVPVNALAVANGGFFMAALR